jgi:hypothetical protein
MRKQHRACSIGLVIGGAALAWGPISTASAAVLVNDNVSGDTVGNAPANYTTGGVAGGITLSTVDDSNNLSTGGGNALSAAATASTT